MFLFSLLGKLKKLPVAHRAGIFFGLALIVVFLAYRFFGWIMALGVLGAIVLVALLWLVLGAFVRWQKKRKSDQFDRELAGEKEEPGIGKAEVQRARQELIHKWGESVAELRKANLNLYDLPWFLLIGEPQSGKSTTLMNSGLEFPIGMDAISGVGGTRNCDWWFANEAVILDTAGRFTFQESNAPDKDEWVTFLSLLRRHRKACPVNGVIVVIPTTSLLEDSPEQLEEKAKNIRNKLGNIQQILEIEFPVFLLITKADRILGFTEFLSKLGTVEQRQLFGWSNTGPFDESYDPETVRPAFEALYRRLHRWRMKFLGEDLALSEADKLFVFPEELYALREPLYEYLRIVFSPTRYAKQPFFRGFYLSSGMQQGRPIAKACSAMLGSGQGAESGVIEELEKVFQKSRAFCIRDFYKEKVFRERGLVFRTPEAVKRDRVLRLTTWIGGGALLAASIAFLVHGVVTFNRELGPVRASVEQSVSLIEADQAPSMARSFAQVRDLSGQIERLLGSGSTAAFLRGKENTLVRDLGTIHRTLFGKRVLVPVMETTGKFLSEIPPEDSPRIDLYLGALLEYLRLLVVDQWPSRDPTTELAATDIVPIILYRAAAAGDESYSFNPEEIRAEYERFTGEGGMLPDLPGGKAEVDGVLRNLERFWDVSPEMAPYRGLVELGAKIDDSYRAMGGLDTGIKPVAFDPTRKRVRAFIEAEKAAKKNVDALNAASRKTTFPEEIYRELIADLDDGSEARKPLIDELRRQMKIVQEKVQDRIVAELTERSYLVELGGREPLEGEEAEAGKKALVSLTPLLRDAAGHMAKVGEFFDEVDAADQAMDRLSEEMASRQARQRVEALRQHNERMVTKMTEISSNVTLTPHEKQPNWWGGDVFAGELPTVLNVGHTEYLRRVMPSWITAYRAFSLREPSGETMNWSRFKSDPVFNRGEGAYQIYEPLDRMIDAISSAMPEQFSLNVEEAEKFAGHIAKLVESKKRIHDDCEAMVKCVWELDEDPVKAWQQLHDAKKTDLTNWSNLLALESLRQELDNRFTEERALSVLSRWSSRARDILTQDVAAAIAEDWRDMEELYRKRIDGRYPFGASKKPEDEEGDLHRLSISHADFADIRDFFQGEKGIGGIADRYRFGYYLDAGKDVPDILQEPQKEFLRTCERWRAFLFDMDGERQHELVMEFEPKARDAAREHPLVGQRFTQLRLISPGGVDVTFRPSSDIAKKFKLKWRPDEAGDARPLTVKGVNEGTGAAGVLEINGGALSLLGYVTQVGLSERGRDRRYWMIRVEIPDPTTTGGKTEAVLRVVFDEEVPEFPKL